MCIVPALGIILAYVVFKTKYKLNDEFMKKVISKITGSSTSSEQVLTGKALDFQLSEPPKMAKKLWN